MPQVQVPKWDGATVSPRSHHLTSCSQTGPQIRKSVQQLFIPFTKRKTLASRAFSTVALRWWNQLPTDIKKSQNIECSKAKLKTHLFNEYYKC